jgi:hypothetical protein
MAGRQYGSTRGNGSSRPGRELPGCI